MKSNFGIEDDLETARQDAGGEAKFPAKQGDFLDDREAKS